MARKVHGTTTCPYCQGEVGVELKQTDQVRLVTVSCDNHACLKAFVLRYSTKVTVDSKASPLPDDMQPLTAGERQRRAAFLTWRDNMLTPVPRGYRMTQYGPGDLTYFRRMHPADETTGQSDTRALTDAVIRAMAHKPDTVFVGEYASEGNTTVLTGPVPDALSQAEKLDTLEGVRKKSGSDGNPFTRVWDRSALADDTEN